MGAIELIKSDLFRYAGTTSSKAFIKTYIKEAGFRFSVAFRLVNAVGGLKLLGAILWKLRNHQQIQILRKTKIGYGLYISHGGPVVVNPSTVIGNNCNLSQFVTIGSNEGKVAVIGDNVYIGPNTCIVEDVCIGDNATIGAGSVVTKDIPSNATAAGNYAKVLNFNNPGRYVENRWSCTSWGAKLLIQYNRMPVNICA